MKLLIWFSSKVRKCLRSTASPLCNYLLVTSWFFLSTFVDNFCLSKMEIGLEKCKLTVSSCFFPRRFKFLISFADLESADCQDAFFHQRDLSNRWRWPLRDPCSQRGQSGVTDCLHLATATAEQRAFEQPIKQHQQSRVWQIFHCLVFVAFEFQAKNYHSSLSSKFFRNNLMENDVETNESFCYKKWTFLTEISPKCLFTSQSRLVWSFTDFPAIRIVIFFSQCAVRRDYF